MEKQLTKLSDLMRRTVMGDAAMEVAEVAKFPLETSHLMALCHASWAVGMNYRICFYDGDSIPVNLFYMAEARSGEGKSRAMKMLTKGMTKAIEDEKANRAKKRGEILNRFADNNGGKPDNAPAAEREMLERELVKNHDLGHTVSDMTGAAFDKMLKDQLGWFVLKTTEQGLIDSLLLGSHTDGGANIDPFLNAFDGEYTETRRITRDGFSGIPHGGIGIVSQSGLIEKMLEISGNRGLTQRFLMMLEPTIMGTRVFKRHTINTDGLDKFNGICGDITKNAIKSVQVFKYENLTELRISNSGWDAIYDFKNKIEHNLGPGGRYEPAILSSMWSKIEIFVMKIAATLYIMNFKNEKKEIDDETVMDALLIVDCLFTGVSNIAERKGIVGCDVEERAVLEFLEEKTKLRGLDAQRIKNTLSRRKVFSEYQDNKSKRVGEVTDELVKKGKVSKQNIDGNDFFRFVKF